MIRDRDLELVRELHPTADSCDSAPARAALLAAIEQVDRPRPRKRRRRAPFGAVLAAAAVAVGVIVALSLRGGAANPPPAAAAVVLQRAASAAAAGGGRRRLRPGEYWYTQSIWTVPGVQLAGTADTIVDALSTYERQAWIGLDRPGRVESHTVGKITFLSAAARRQWIRLGRPRELPGYSGPLPANAFIRPYAQLLTLPTNVDALWRLLYREAGNGNSAWKRHEMFTEIGDLLREDPIPAAVRAALYLVAARIPGIKLVGLTRDAIGRPALAVTLNDTAYGQRDELLFDPKTSALLGERTVGVKPGTTWSGATYITSGIVERLGQMPGR